MDRKARLLGNCNRSSRILEIGPSYNPVAPKSGGWNTQVVDHATRDALRAKYAHAQVDLEAIEPVDWLWRDGMLHDALPATWQGSFDRLIASHVIEHTTDFAGFLNSAGRLLSPDGTIALAVPDRRFCFDCFRPATTTGDLLEAHTAKRTRHSLRTAWDHVAYAASMDGVLGWDRSHTGTPRFIDNFSAAAATFALFRDDPDTPYADYHAWQFTPAGFRLAILELGQLGVIDWRVTETYGPDSFEFFVFLRRGTPHFEDAEALQTARLSLLRQQWRETREQADIALADAGLPVGLEAGTTVSCHLNMANSETSGQRKILTGTDRKNQHLPQDGAQPRKMGVTRATRSLLRKLGSLWR